MLRPRFYHAEGSSGKGTSGNGRSPETVRERTRRRGQKQRRIRERLSAYRDSRRRERPPRRPRMMVPSFFTLMNLFCGFLALTQIHEGALIAGCWLIVLAGFFDALDGMLARLTDASSPFGVELDSLSDVVSFGVAPAYLVWVFGLNEFGPVGLIVAALPALCGAVRLARYNVMFSEEKADYFEGLPIPAQAITLVVLILTLGDADWFSRADMGNLSVLIPAVFVLAGLMVSNVRFDAVPKPTLDYVRAHPYRTIAYGVAIALLPILQEIGLLIMLGGYILHGIVESIYRLVQAVMSMPIDDPPDNDASDT